MIKMNLDIPNKIELPNATLSLHNHYDTISEPHLEMNMEGVIQLVKYYQARVSANVDIPKTIFNRLTKTYQSLRQGEVGTLRYSETELRFRVAFSNINYADRFKNRTAEAQELLEPHLKIEILEAKPSKSKSSKLVNMLLQSRASLSNLNQDEQIKNLIRQSKTYRDFALKGKIFFEELITLAENKKIAVYIVYSLLNHKHNEKLRAEREDQKRINLQEKS